MLKIREMISKKWKEIIAIFLISISIVFFLQDLVKSFSIPIFYRPYIVVFPAIVAVLLKILCNQKKYVMIVNKIYYATWVAIIEYWGLILLNKIELSSQVKICVYMITVFYLVICGSIKVDIVEEIKEYVHQDDEKKIFSLYYINTEKVYEIAMLLNNKIITGGTSENEMESGLKKQTNYGISANLNYLETIKGELGISQNTEMHSGIKNKVLENFDVKTTKSNMLASIIAKAKIYKENEKVNLGDLVLLKNASLKLLNEEESYAVTKMILNGAFKDTKISSNSDDMKIEFDLSAMINSLLKDCAYELGCVVGQEKFLLTIPMTFESDFENSYNIYDLQVGDVTVVGIYRGKRQYEKRLSLQEIFSENNENNKGCTYENDEYQLHSSVQKEKQTTDFINNASNQPSAYKEVIDVIAVIQEINVE